MAKKRKVPFPSYRGFVAAPASAFGGEFSVLEAMLGIQSEGEASVIDICGPLVQHESFMFPSYDSIKRDFQSALASDSKTIILRIDSPGGDFAGCLELSRYMRSESQRAGKKLIAYTDSQALSAGYALACAASEIVITTSAFVGSIGVWAALCDQTAQDRAQGLNIAIISSGEQKAERNPHVPITESSMANLQVEVDAMASLFFEVVSESRGLSLNSVVGLQGSQQFGEAAARSGLADRVVNDWETFLTTLGEKPMASLKELRGSYRTSLAKKAAEDSDEGREAASELAAWDKEESKKAKKAEAEDDKKDDKEETKASASDDSKEEKKEEASAKAEDNDGDADDKEQSKKAAASNLTLELARKVQALEAERAAEKLEAARSKLLASRPDFTPEVRATLENAPLETVKAACETWPRIATANEAAVNALTPKATAGVTQSNTPSANGQYIGDLTEAEFIARKMGLAQAGATGVIKEGRSLSLGFMSPAEAARKLAEINSKGSV